MVSPLRGLSFFGRASQLIRGVMHTPVDSTFARGAALIAASALLVGCATASHDDPLRSLPKITPFTIGGKPIVPPQWPIEPTPCGTVPPGGNPMLYTVHRGATLCAFGVRFNDVAYGVDVSCAHKEIILYVSTTDPKFRTPEGLSTASSLREALAVGGTFLPERMCDVRLPSGWIVDAAIGVSAPGDTPDQCSEPLAGGIRGFRKEPIDEERCITSG